MNEVVFQWVSFAFNILLGGGFLVTFLTLKATRKKAGAEAEKAAAAARADEIKNVESAIKIWRDMAESMAVNYTEMSAEVQKLSKEVKRLTTINNKILKLLDRITPENLEHTVAAIKQEINTD